MPTDAIDPLPLIHVPVPVASLNVVVCPIHTLAIPVIGSGSGFTVIVLVAIHPVVNSVVIVATPADTPVTTPETGSTEATPALLLDHVPPGTDSVIFAVCPWHIAAGPPTGPIGFTVIAKVVLHPSPIIYVIIVTPPPPPTPVTNPLPETTVAIVGALLTQLPGIVPSINIVPLPSQMLDNPVMGDGGNNTVTVVVDRHPAPIK
jgi:hypothetical protein